MELKETTISEKKVYEGIIVDVRVDEVRIADGSVRRREVVEHPGGVAVIAVDDRGRMILVRQYRYPVGEVVLEFPAGKLEPGEDPREAGLRELSEETGLTAGRFESLGVSYSSPGILAERIHYFLARDLRQEQAHPDDGEFVEPVWLTLDELTAMAASGELKDGKTLAGLMKAKLALG